MWNWFKLEKKRDVKLEIDISKHIDYIKAGITKMIPKNMHIEKFDTNLDINKIEKVKCIEKETYHPIITFHATSNIDTLNSIMQCGYVVPNDINPITGIMQEYRTGNLYGEGVYSSTDIKSICGYCEYDKNFMLYFIVNIVFLGEIEQISLNTKYKYDLHAKYDTTISYDKKLVVSRNANNIIPIASILVRCAISGGSHYITINNKMIKLHDIKTNTNEIINFTKVMNDGQHDYYVIRSKDKDELLTPKKINHILVIPMHILKNKLNLEMIDNFVNSLDNVIIIIYNNSTGFLMSKKNNLHNINFRTLKNVTYMELKQYVKTLHIKSQKFSDLKNILEDILELPKYDELNIMYFFFDLHYKGNEIKEICQKQQLYLKRPKTMIRSIYLDKIDHTKDIIKDTYYLKYLDNVSEHIYCNTDRFIFECNTSQGTNNLASLFKIFINDIEHLNIESNNTYKVPYPSGKYGEGFLTHLTELPVWHVESDNYVLYKGIPPKYIWFNNSIVKIIIDDIDNDNNTIFSIFIKSVIKLLSKFKNTIILDPYLYSHYKLTLSEFTNSLITLLDQHIIKGNYIDKIKYLYNYVNSIMNELTLYSSIKNFDSELFFRLKKLKFSNRITKRVIKNMDNNDDNDIELEKMFTKCCDIKGYVCQIINTESSCVDPWLIMIKKVSLHKMSISDVYNYKEFGIYPSLQDNIDFKWNGIIINNNMQKICKAFTAYQYTNNYKLIIPNQYIAINTSATISILERILLYVKLNKKKSILSDKNYILQQLMIAEDIFKSIKYNAERYKNLYDKLLNKPYETLSNKNDVPSITIVLGLIKYFSNKIEKELCKAIFMESLYRTVETCIKMQKIDRYNTIKKLLFNPNYIKIFFQNRFISTSPFATISFLEYCRLTLTHDMQTIANSYINHNISVINFFERYFQNIMNKNNDKNKLQLALVLVSIDKQYIDDNFDSDYEIEKYKKDLIRIESEMENLKKKHEEKKQMILNKNNNKILSFIESNQVYLIAHKDLPRIFTKEEIIELNNKRKKDDQLELQYNGLLKHHCCYEKCPAYLKNFATHNDIKNKTRKGLFSHFKLNFILNNYYNGIHVWAKRLYDSKTHKKTFEETMRRFIIKNIGRKILYDKVITNKNINSENRISKRSILYNNNEDDFDESLIDKDTHNDINFVISKLYESYYGIL
jgi:hypothetical protein